ncbi:OmpH family outer membrane protein [Magnetospirillum fulvum]|uniref:Periplasmic chaperone for outer membrane proteins Skp n=1 Tax=Magnetospirillum fulvum TaxID=1082 RepID=A0A1H6GRW9_MAGFU|nr:OmpH family outer membrane protein [Magnetospirillum fulvum]SEH24575.1 periplasmic chaperone for outer membrane proteins Skp [Magnetospirillum fulvum]
MGILSAVGGAGRWAGCGLAMVLAASVAFAADPPAAKRATAVPATIIIVDVQQAQRESLAGKALVSQRDHYQQSFQNDFNSARQRLQVSDQDLARQKGTMSQEAYDQKVKDLEQQVVAFQRRTQMAVRALEKSTDSAVTELMNVILSVTGELAGEMGATLVLPKQQVVLHEPSMDVTTLVIERVNRRLPNVTFPVPVVEDSPSAKPGRK